MAIVANGLAFGLNWYTSTSDTVDEMQKEARKYKAKAVAEVKSDGTKMYGFADVKKWSGTYSAAACLAETLPSTGIFIHDLNGGAATCLIAVDAERRLPLFGLDIVGPRRQIIERAQVLIQEQKDLKRNLAVYGDVIESEIEGAESMLLSRLAKEGMSGQLKAVKPVDTRWAIPFVIAAAVAAIVYSDEISDLVTDRQKPPAVPLEVQYRTQVAAAVNQVVQSNQFPSNVMPGFIPFLKEVANEAAGWKLDTLKCADTDCVATWRRTAGATTEGLLHALNLKSNDVSINFPDVDTATRKLKFTKESAARKLVMMPNAAFSQLVGSWLQRLQDRKLDKPLLSQLTPLVGPNGATKLTPGDIPKFGNYQFTVPFYMDDLQTVQNLPDSLTIETIEISRDGVGMKIKFTGKFYAF